MSRSNSLAIGALLAATVPCAGAAGHVLANTRLSVTFADTAVFAFPDADRVDRITWIDSAGLPRSNYVAEGNALHCGDPQEFFGESYAEPDGTLPLMVFAGVKDTWKGTGTTKGTAKTAVTGACDTAPTATTTTRYKVFAGAGQVNEMQVTRTFNFGSTTPVFTTHGVRSYVPRTPRTSYHFVLVPDAAGTAIVTYDSAAFGGLEVTDWNGRWFADDDGTGYGVMVIRSASSVAPALIFIDNDLNSFSNVTSIVLRQPATGWKAPLAETQYLCFYDPTTWPSSVRASGKMPTGCAGTKP